VTRAGGTVGPRPPAGFTLLELLLALALCSVLFLALARLVDTSTGVWERAEAQRELGQTGARVLELLAGDLRSLESGSRGDFLCEWVAHDLDGDGVATAARPRLRLVREASAAERARIGAGPAGAATAGLVEVAWAFVPGDDAVPPGGLAEVGSSAAHGTLLRAVAPRRVESPESLFAPGVFGADGRPDEERFHVVSGSVLWWSLRFADVAVEAPWAASSADGLDAGAGKASWDALGAGRPDPEQSAWNRGSGGVAVAPADAGGREPAASPSRAAALPARAFVELELERAVDLRRRTRLASAVQPEDTVLQVDDPRRLPAPGTFLLLGEEWVELVSVAGDEARVQRGRRTSVPTWHDARTLLHHGHRLAREVTIPVGSRNPGSDR